MKCSNNAWKEAIGYWWFLWRSAQYFNHFSASYSRKYEQFMSYKSFGAELLSVHRLGV